LDSHYPARKEHLYAGALALGPEHGENIPGTFYAKELARFFFIILDPMLAQEGNNVLGRKPRERGLAEMRVFRKIVSVRHMQIREVASPSAGDEYFGAHALSVVEHEHGAAAFSALQSAHQSRRARSDDDDVFFHRIRIILTRGHGEYYTEGSGKNQEDLRVRQQEKESRL
jgi:hypothetical protein